VAFHTRKIEEIPCDPQLRKGITGNFYDHREILIGNNAKLPLAQGEFFYILFRYGWRFGVDGCNFE
jgi:hypothetical protein